MKTPTAQDKTTPLGFNSQSLGNGTQSVKAGTKHGLSNWREFEWFDRNHTPSWKRHGDGSAQLRVEYCTGRGFLQFNAYEYDQTTNHTKEVFITLDDTSADALVAFIEAFKNRSAATGKES